MAGWDAGMVRVVLSAATGGVSLARAMLGAASPTAEADSPANVIEALSKSKARVLIVHGSDDMIVPAGNRARWRNAFPEPNWWRCRASDTCRTKRRPRRFWTR